MSDTTSEPGTLSIPLNGRTKVYGLIFGILILVGGVTSGRFLASSLFPPEEPVKIPLSAKPGPPRTETLTYQLTTDSSLAMIPHNDAKNERWADVAGNFYSGSFIKAFSYEDSDPEKGPWVRVKLEPVGETLKGRLEAKGLKPNFAYQVKLRGNYSEDPIAFGIIGGLGRWRLPGRETNFSDQDFLDYPNKGDAEGYLLFDFFITDENGDAVRELELNHSLHVLWNAARQRGKDIPEGDIVEVLVKADNPAIYARPKTDFTNEEIWAERERNRYDGPGYLNYLPAKEYKADLVLTEESFHATGRDGGWWASVFSVPIEFTIQH